MRFIGLAPRIIKFAFLPILACAVLRPGAVAAMVGGAAAPDAAIARHVVMIVGSRGNFCTGSVLARDLVLTVAHCVLPGSDYKLLELDADGQPQFRDVAEVARHPQFDLNSLFAHRATADVALLKLKGPLPDRFAPATLTSPARAVTIGDALTVAGYGVALRGDGKTGGTARAAALTVTGKPGSLQIRLVDPATRGERAGLGACTGDSGAPVFARASGGDILLGVVSWSTGPRDGGGCGGITGVTPLASYRPWILATARRMGVALASQTSGMAGQSAMRPGNG
jgi:secreted trypsin-like serine protease